MEHERCNASACLNNGSCLLRAKPGHMRCMCTDHYYGPHCEWKDSDLRLSIDVQLEYVGGVIQYFDIDFTSLDLLLVDQKAYETLPTSIAYRRGQATVPAIVLARLYFSHKDITASLYLLSLQINVSSLAGTAEINSDSHCPDVHTLSNGNLSMVIFIDTILIE